MPQFLNGHTLGEKLIHIIINDIGADINNFVENVSRIKIKYLILNIQRVDLILQIFISKSQKKLVFYWNNLWLAMHQMKWVHLYCVFLNCTLLQLYPFFFVFLLISFPVRIVICQFNFKINGQSYLLCFYTHISSSWSHKHKLFPSWMRDTRQCWTFYYFPNKRKLFYYYVCLCIVLCSILTFNMIGLILWLLHDCILNVKLPSINITLTLQSRTF